MAKSHFGEYSAHVEKSSTDSRHERRKAATRAALVRAATEILVEDGPEVTVQAIADRADVGLGSFYNHFTGKPDLFAAVATAALTEFEASLIERTSHLVGVTSVFAARMRLYGRMHDTHPSIAVALSRLPPSPELAPHGYSLRALDDATRALESAEIVVDDLDIRLIAAVGSLRHLALLRQRDASIGPERVDDLVAVLLEMFGLSAGAAAELAHRPLDEVLQTGVSMPLGS